MPGRRKCTASTIGGRYFRSRGPFTVPRSAQGHPVIIQAGASGRGRRFGAQWGEVIFVAYPNVEIGRREYAEFKADVARCGREPEHVQVTQLINTVAAATKAEAEDKWAEIDKLPLEIDALSLLSEALNFDFARKGMDEPFTAEELAEMSGLQGIRDRVLRASGKKNPTVRDFIQDQRPRARAQSDRRRPEGGGRQLEEWFAAPACDGFVALRHPRPGRLRGLRALRRARTAAPRPVPQRIRRHDVARKSGTAGAGAGRMAQIARAESDLI